MATELKSNQEDSSADSDGDVFEIGSQTLNSRLILGSGKYDSFELMQESIVQSGTECVTIAVRREKLHDSSGRNILDYLDYENLILLPNTSGCYDAETAVRCARMGREILKGLNNPGENWVKLEVLGDSRSLLPDAIESIKATEMLVKEGFEVLCYTNDDPVTAIKLKNAGATSVMPAASPIGSGLGIVNPVNLQIILEELKQNDPSYPVIVDAGIGSASDAAQAMELGADAVLLNSAVARAEDPVGMSIAMKAGVFAGRKCFLSGRIAKTKYASASSPEHGLIAKRKQNG